MKRFEDKIDRSGGPDACHEWQEGLRSGYGRFWYEGKSVGAHRFAYEMEYGPIPEGAYVLHSCDNKKCVNPAHLRVGTPQDNMDDKMERGRGNPVQGINHPGAKLTEAQVLEIRAVYSRGGRTQRSLATEYGIAQSLVSMIVNRRLWGHL